ncbi:hypothetical protein [Paenibacillus durus]|uniref:DUF4064 domain-containing protein n=1 Tax=Paenibacillus durus ATCC 35681 TaxID=1333534 RepID=A0A0F7CGB0_PAEDU|nr:hypothetical protein [Paenibacillus durus]AKG33346.1 hypothetical protein VK70_00905 [Paenibacillus durus ATCC 35681]
MKMPLSIKVIQGLMILQIFALGIPYFVVSQVDPMRSSGYWANKIVYSMIDNMPQDMSEQSYVLGRIQGGLMFPLILTSLIFTFIKMKRYKSSIVCIILVILASLGQGTLIVAIPYLVILMVMTINKRSKLYFKRVNADPSETILNKHNSNI